MAESIKHKIDIKSLMEQNNIKSIKKPTGLGKGLSALLANNNTKVAFQEDGNLNNKKIINIDIRKLKPGKYQPRKYFNNEAIEDLAQSIRTKGVLQPILVRKHSEEGYFEIIAGERRWRASKVANLEVIPAIVEEFSDKEVLEIGLIENLQRQDLNPIEEAKAFDLLLKEYNYTHNQLAEIIGKNRTYITNYLRMLTLPENIQNLIEQGKISVGHAKVLVNVSNAADLVKKIISENLSVRALENITSSSKSTNEKVPNKYIDYKDKFSQVLKDYKINVVSNKSGGGFIKIQFLNEEKLNELLEILNINK